MRKQIIEAFMETRNDRSVDFVIADSETNRLFLRACKSRRVKATRRDMNLDLLNARKSGDLKGIKSKKTIIRNQDEYRFASEIAVRFLEQRDDTTLDRILCDPNKAAQFEKIARSISPGFAAFEYRWAALNLRKRRKLEPEL